MLHAIKALRRASYQVRRELEVCESFGRVVSGQHLAPILLGEALNLQASGRRRGKGGVPGEAEKQLSALFFQHELEAWIVAARTSPRVHHERVVAAWDDCERGFNLMKALANLHGAGERHWSAPSHQKAALAIQT